MPGLVQPTMPKIDSTGTARMKLPTMNFVFVGWIIPRVRSNQPRKPGSGAHVRRVVRYPATGGRRRRRAKERPC